MISLGVGDHLVLARRVVRHHEPVRLGFGGHRLDVDPDDLAGQVVAVQVRRQRRGHVRDQRGLREPHHHRGGQVVLVDEVAVENGLRHPDLGGDLVHADVAAASPDRLQGAVYQLVAALHLVLVPAPLASIGLDRPRRGLLCHYRASPFPRSYSILRPIGSLPGRVWHGPTCRVVADDGGVAHRPDVGRPGLQALPDAAGRAARVSPSRWRAPTPPPTPSGAVACGG